MKRRIWLIAAALLLASGCASMNPPVDVVTTAAQAPNFTLLSKAIQQAGLTETLKGTGPFTVFAPTDEAFKRLPAGALEKLLANPEQLRSVLTYHVVSGRVASGEFKNGAVKTVQGAPLTVSRAGTFVIVDEATVIQPDIAATNGIIHAVDRVLMPPPAKK
ncbi:MAG: fasciclin domain-containing protein [Proteobacteria bacterium]|nr:fasciclin domain-containing protein [Burkholderiales bacterium]